MSKDMKKGGLVKFILIEPSADSKYIVHYPSIIFPNKCVVCGNPQVGSREIFVGVRKLVSSTYSAPTRYNTYADVRMNFEIPLCKDHIGVNNINDHIILEAQQQKRINRFLIISAALSFIVLPLVFSSWIGIPVGIGLSILAWYLLAKAIKVGKKKKTYFYDEPYTKAYEISLEDVKNFISMKIVIQIENDQIWNEFKSLNKIEEHLIAAMNSQLSGSSLYDQNIPICENAIRALVQTRCETAVPAIIDKFIVNLGQVFDNNNKICDVAAEALESFGIHEPLDAKKMEQLVVGLNNMYVREAVIRVLNLYGIEHLIAGLNCQDAGARIAVINALGRIKDERAVPAIIERLSDTKKSYFTRVDKVAVEALKQIGTPEALEAIERWKTKPQK